MNEFAKCEKNFSIMMGTAVIVYDAISECFHYCECSSLLFDSMYLNFVEMTDKQVERATEKTNYALRKCQTGGMTDLDAQVRMRRTPENVKMVFSTMGYGDITAEINKWGDVKIAA